MNKKTLLVGSIVLLLIIIVVLVNPAKKMSSREPIKLGGISALTGVGVAIGEEERKGALLAIEDLNTQGGVLGHPLELISEDVSLDKIKNAVSVVQKLINVDKVVAIVGPQWDEPALPILPIIESAQVPTIGADSTPGLEADKNYEYFFSTWYDNRVGIREILRYAQKNNLKNIAIIKPLSAGFWEYTAKVLKNEAKNYGVTIVAEEDLGNPLLLDFKTVIAKVKSHNPDAIFAVTSDYNQCTFLKQLKELGYNKPTLGTESSGDPTSLEQCPLLMENRYFSTPVHSSAYADFAERFKKRFGDYPKFPSAETAYDAVMVIAKALEKTNLQGGKVLRDAIIQTNNLKGVSSDNIKFNDIGFVSTPENGFEMQVVKNGKFIKAE